MKFFLLACAGGAIGVGLRYLLNMVVLQTFELDMPWATLAANVLGSFAMGALIAYIYYSMPHAMALRTFIATGVLGGFTTFSAFSLDTLFLFERGDAGLAFLYVVSSAVLSITACVVGYLGVQALIL